MFERRALECNSSISTVVVVSVESIEEKYKTRQEKSHLTLWELFKGSRTGKHISYNIVR